jgi:hypothetical protein
VKNPRPLKKERAAISIGGPFFESVSRVSDKKGELALYSIILAFQVHVAAIFVLIDSRSV